LTGVQQIYRGDTGVANAARHEDFEMYPAEQGSLKSIRYLNMNSPEQPKLRDFLDSVSYLGGDFFTEIDTPQP
jgi:hypothetical protein